jgi:geranylgeranyl pyrophosphate synthase
MAPEEKIAQVLNIYNALGVREIAEKEIGIHFSKAMEALNSLEAPEERIAPMRELAQSLLGRKN